MCSWIIFMPDIENQTSEASAITTDEIHDQTTSLGIFKKLSKLSWQMSASYTFSLQMVSLIYLLSQLSDNDEHLASASQTTSLINAIVAIGVSPLFSMSLAAGEELGALQKAKADGESEAQLAIRRDHISAVLGNGLIMSAVISPFMILPMVFSKSLLTNVFDQNPDVSEITQSFVRPYAIMVPAMLIRVCCEQIMFMFERTKPAMLIGMSNFAFSTTLGSVLAFGLLGAPKLGRTGLLIGSILDIYLTALGYALYVAFSPRLKEYNFFNLYKPWAPYLGQLKEITNLSRTYMLGMTTETIGALITNAYAGVVGVQQQAAFSIIMQFSLLSFLLQVAFGQTCSQEMKREIGKNDFSNASHTGKVGLATTLFYIAPIPLALSVYPNVLLDMMGIKNQSIKKTLPYLAPIMFAGNILDAARDNILQQMRMIGDSKKSALISSGSIILGVIVSGLLGLQTRMGIYGVAAGYSGSIALAATILFMRWLTRIKPSAIQHNQRHPEQFFSVKACCDLFFIKKSPRLLSVTDDSIQMNVTNPVITLQGRTSAEHKCMN